MKLAIIGSRQLQIDDLRKYLPDGVSEIVTGGARGVDTCAMQYAEAHSIVLKTFLPDYQRYGRAAPLRRNLQIIEYTDKVLAFWDGESRGTRYVINECRQRGIPICVYLYQSGEFLPI